MEYILIIIAIFLLTVGANNLVSFAMKLGNYFKINPAFLGLVVLGFGTSLPELQTSIDAAYKNLLPLSYGNIIGSNIFNVLFILSVCSLISNLLIKNIYKVDIYFLIITNLLFAFFLMSVGINYYTSIILILLFIANIIKSYTFHKTDYINAITKESIVTTNINYINIVFLLITGFFGLFMGAHLLVNNSIIIAYNLNISEKIIGITIVAIGTSLPELATSLVASIKKQNQLAVYNIIGSNVFNVSIVAGISGLIKPFYLGNIFTFDLIFFLIALLVLAIVSIKYNNNNFPKIFGLFALLCFIIYLIFLFSK